MCLYLRIEAIYLIILLTSALFILITSTLISLIGRAGYF